MVTSLVKKMLKGDRQALARLMTFVDNRHESLLEMMKAVYPHTGKAVILGVTGPPGAGKSTLVDKLIGRYRAQGKTVGVVAIDPSSPFTGGAVLGDRIRMMDHGADDGVFIRSLGSRGSHGGLSRATREVAHLMDAFGFDVIIIETVGVGQTELDIMNVAMATLVVLVPESGDTIQTMKAGLMEIADIFIVNKADREGADRIFAELKSLGEIFKGAKKIPVVKTVAVKGEGVDTLVTMIDESRKNAAGTRTFRENAARLLTEEMFDILLGEIHLELCDHIKDKYASLVQELAEKHHNPYRTAEEIFSKIKWGK